MLERRLPVALWIFSLLLCLASPAGFAATDDKAAQIEALMAKYVALKQFNGSILVAQNSQILFQKGYGLAEMEWGIPNAPDTKFRLGSVTKQSTSLLILQLVQEGKITLDAKVADVLPYYRKDTGSKITIRQLLTHTSGLPNYTARPDFRDKLMRNPSGVEDFVKGYCSGDLEFEPGTKFNYSNSGYFVLGAVIELLTGKPYEQILKERILDPIGMKDTGYDHSAALLMKRAAGYEKTPGGYVNTPYLDMSLPYAAGALYSTVGDLYLWDQALYSDRLLPAELKRQMFTPGLENYAFGWSVRQMPVGPVKANRTVTAHGGGINGFSTLISRVTEDRHLVVLLDNTAGGQFLQPITNGVFDILYGRVPPNPKKSLSEVLGPICASQGLEAAIARYREIKGREADAYDLREAELNMLGYMLLGQKKFEDAIAVFKLNLEAFPESANCYDSLAEGYMAAGQKELAIKNYAKSLELNPANRGAVEQLNKLTQ
jgi:CubicO group peptidase (beta-lactamase class C family)